MTQAMCDTFPMECSVEEQNVFLRSMVTIETICECVLFVVVQVVLEILRTPDLRHLRVANVLAILGKGKLPRVFSSELFSLYLRSRALIRLRYHVSVP